MMTHEEIRESLGAHALCALSSEEATEVERHLDTCIECRDELTSLQETAATLVELLPPVTPPPDLREKILRSVGTPEAVIRAPFKPPLRAPFRAFPSAAPRRWSSKVGALPRQRALVTLVACVIIGLGTWVIALTQQLDATRATLILVRHELHPQLEEMKLAVGQSTVSIHLSGPKGFGVVVYDPPTGDGLFLSQGLPQLPSARVYQLWGRRRGSAVSLGTFAPVSGRLSALRVHDDPIEFSKMIVTMETGPMSTSSPSSRPVLQSEAKE